MNYPAKLTDKFDFGKHKTKTVEDVIWGDVTYIEWCFVNIPGFKLDKDASREYDVSYEDYEEQKWLELKNI